MAGESLKNVSDSDPMPFPGSIPHLDWLNRLNPDRLRDPADFLQNTAAVTTISRLVRRHRTRWPLDDAIKSNSIGLDSEEMSLEEVWPDDRRFSARLEIYNVSAPTMISMSEKEFIEKKALDESYQTFADTQPRSINMLCIDGRPFPGSNVHNDVIYSLKIPVTRALLYDTDRSVTASTETSSPCGPAEFFGAKAKKPEVKIFNPDAFEEYGENDKDAFYHAFELAIRDLQFLVHLQMRNRNSLVAIPISSGKKRLKTLGGMALPFRKAA